MYDGDQLKFSNLSKMKLLVLFLWCLLVGVKAETRDEFMRRRQEMINYDNQFRYGQELYLSHLEEVVDAHILATKAAEFQHGIKTEYFLPGLNFMTVRDKIEESEVFKFVKRMPKGGVLHSHLIAAIDPSWLIENATYRSDCYMCVNGLGGVRFHLSRASPGTEVHGEKDCNSWQKVNDVRNSYESHQAFDNQLRLNLTILTPDPYAAYPNINVVWQKADKTWPALADLVFFKPILPAFVTEVLRQCLADGVQYLETRGSLYAMYDYDRKYTPEEAVLVMREAVQTFKLANPDFIGAKYISEMAKVVPKETVGQAVKDAMTVHEKYPDFVAGFDLVAQEDPTNPIIYYLDELLLPSQRSPPYKLPYFFHAGETTWEGTHIDANLYDALLLNASRIGHGYAAVKHTRIMELLRSQDVALEVNPVSNQVLMLVDDIRNHPAATLLAQNYSLTVSSDDPGLWGGLPLSHDMYEMFMGCMPMDQGLRPLKRLAMDSIRYSAMSESEKSVAMTKWMRQWNKFITKELVLSWRRNRRGGSAGSAVVRRVPETK